MKTSKTAPSYFYGRECIQVSLLPFDQSRKIRNWLPDSSYHSLFINSILLKDVVDYHEYEYWYEHFYLDLSNQEDLMALEI
jgi:hypothetical protein